MNMVPKMVEPAAIKAMFVIIFLEILNSCKVQTIKNSPIIKKIMPGMP